MCFNANVKCMQKHESVACVADADTDVYTV